MAGISKRVFGADLNPRVRQKLEIRQALAEQQNPNESIQLNTALFPSVFPTSKVLLLPSISLL